MEGFRIGGKVVNNLRYADDTVILAESEQQLQQLINTVVTEGELKGLYLNSRKQKTADMIHDDDEWPQDCAL